MRPFDETAGRSPSVSTRPAGQLPRLLPAGFAAGPAGLAEHVRRYGPAPSPIPDWPGRKETTART